MAAIHDPWQSGPTELIQAALDHLRQDTDADRRVAFLLLDVGVETCFKTFLTLPRSTTNATGSYSERRRASEGNFHEVVEGVGKAGGSRLEGVVLAHVEHYHRVRNKLYHDGNGLTIPYEQVRGYAVLAVHLLKVLLDLDLTKYLPPLQEASDGGRSRQRPNSLPSNKRPIPRKLGRKYAPLWAWFTEQDDKTVIHMRFQEIEDILGERLPPSARTYREWWANMLGETNVQARAWLEAGWRVIDASVGNAEVVFGRRG